MDVNKKLEKMQAAMENPTSSEIGVWVSGFYGSGKSSLTKYIGMALDDRITIEGVPFLVHFSDRITDKIFSFRNNRLDIMEASKGKKSDIKNDFVKNICSQVKI